MSQDFKIGAKEVMTTDPIRLIRQYRVKYAQTPQPNPQAKSEFGKFMDAAVPPALALGAAGLLLGPLFDRKREPLSNTSALLGLLGTLLGAGVGVMRSEGGQSGSGGQSGGGGQSGSGGGGGAGPPPPPQSAAQGTTSYAPYVGTGLGLVAGAGGAYGGQRFVEKRTGLSQLREFNIPTPWPWRGQPEQVASLVSDLQSLMDDRAATIARRLSEINNPKHTLGTKVLNLEFLAMAKTAVQTNNELVKRVKIEGTPLLPSSASSGAGPQGAAPQQANIVEVPVLSQKSIETIRAVSKAYREYQLDMAAASILRQVAPQDTVDSIDAFAAGKAKEVAAEQAGLITSRQVLPADLADEIHKRAVRTAKNAARSITKKQPSQPGQVFGIGQVASEMATEKARKSKALVFDRLKAAQSAVEADLTLARARSARLAEIRGYVTKGRAWAATGLGGLGLGTVAGGLGYLLGSLGTPVLEEQFGNK